VLSCTWKVNPTQVGVRILYPNRRYKRVNSGGKGLTLSAGGVPEFGGGMFGVTIGPKHLKSPASPLYQKKRFSTASTHVKSKGIAMPSLWKRFAPQQLLSPRFLNVMALRGRDI